MTSIGFLDSLSGDLRYALRAMRRNLTFTVVVGQTPMNSRVLIARR